MDFLSMEEIREYAKMIGVLSVSRFERKDELIRTIQLAEGKEDCFGNNPFCFGEKKCAWMYECIKQREAIVH